MKYKFILIGLMLILFSLNSYAWCSGTDCNSDWLYKQELTLNTEGILTSDVTNEHAILVHVDSSNTDFWDNSITTNFNGRDLVSYWKLDETSGTVLDVLGNNDGTNNGATTGVTGKINTAYDFTSSNSDRINIPDNLNLSFGNGTTDESFSISFWFNPDDLTGTRGIISKGTTATVGEYYFITVGSDLYFRLVDNSSSAYIGKTKASALSTGSGWYHIVATYNGSGSSTGIKLYINGADSSASASDSGAYTAMENTANELTIGTRGTDYSDGKIDEIAIWNRVLSSTEVTQLYNSGNALAYSGNDVRFTRDETYVTTPTPTNYYNFDETSGDLLDQIGSDDGTNSNVTQGSTGYINNAYTYNGTNSYTDIASILSDLQTTTAGTWSAWIKKDNDGTDGSIIMFGNTGANYQLRLQLQSDNTLYASTYNGSSAQWVWESGEPIPYDSWQQVIMTHDGTEPSFYLNGKELSGSFTTSTDKTFWFNDLTFNSGSIGRFYNSALTGVYYEGEIDEVAFWNSALSYDEIRSLYAKQSQNFDTVTTSATGSYEEVLNYHFEDVDTDTNDLWAWVRVPSFDADANTLINMYYGNPDAIDNQNEEGTYPSGYQAVWHMNSLLDSTSNNNDLTIASGTPTLTTTGCSISYCYDFDGSGDYMSFTPNFSGSTSYTLWNWFEADTYPASSVEPIWNVQNSGATTNRLRIEMTTTEIAYTLHTTSTTDTASLNTLYNYAATVGAAQDSIYRNGAFSKNLSSYSINISGMNQGYFGTKVYDVGNGDFDGTIDESKFFNYQLSSDEISLLYNSENQSLLSFGAQEMQIGVTADFDYSLNQTTNVLTLTDTSTDQNVTISDWNWLVNSSTTGLSNANAQNPTFSGVISATDYNISLCVGGIGTDANFYSDCTAQTISFGGGVGQFNFYDENSLAELTGVEYTISPSINGLSSGTLTDNNLDLNLQGITATEYLFTFSKTGYGTRYYQTDLNQFSELDINFALNPSSLSSSIPFKVYQTDETTIFSNTFIELYLPDKNNWIVGKQKTNSAGEVTFSIDSLDQNYYANINNGEFIYQPVALTVLYPINENTLTQITEDWKIDITQNLYVSYTDLNTDKIIYLLPNTSDPYNIRVGDMNGNYFERTYAQQFPGNPLTATLQPYLVPIDSGLLTTIKTVNATTNFALPGITIKIYKNISGSGRTLVEQQLTDAKGEALSLLELNAEYEFETYLDGTFLKTYNITATSSTIVILIEQATSGTDVNDTSFGLNWTPINSGLIKQAGGNTTFTQSISNNGSSSISVVSSIIQNGVTLDSDTYSGTGNPSFSYNIANADINIGTITSQVIITYNGINYLYKKDYFVNSAFDTNYNIFTGASTGLRSDFGCDSTGICMPLLILGIIISIAVVLFASVKVVGVGTESAAIMFVIMMSFFSYLTWIPLELALGSVLIVGAFIINQRRS